MSSKSAIRTIARDALGRFCRAKDAMRAAKQAKAAQLKEAPEVSFQGNYNTCQIYSSGFEFAFMSKVKGIYEQVCTFVYCKDFLHDAVWAWINKTKWSIYSFNYDSAKHHPIDADNCVFAFRNTQYTSKSQDFHEQRETCIEFLNGFEKKCGFEPSQVFEVPHPKGIPCWIVIGDKRWQHAPALVGLYTLLIRVGFAHPLGTDFSETLDKCRDGKIKVGDGQGAGRNDPGYIKQSWQGIQAVLEHGTDCFHPQMVDNYPLDLPKKTSLHNNCGPVNWTKGSCKTGMPRWYKHL